MRDLATIVRQNEEAVRKHQEQQRDKLAQIRLANSIMDEIIEEEKTEKKA